MGTADANGGGSSRTGSVRAGQATFTLEGRVALVTGASRGIGWAIARDLANAGAHLILASRDRVALAERTRTLRQDGHCAELVEIDVTAPASIAEAVERALAVHRRIDILVNNAGAGMRHPFLDTTDADITRVMDTNLRGPFHLARTVAVPMREQGSGSIINIGSALSVLGRSKAVLYTASKHALAGMTKSLACELAPSGIRVNAICPGYVETEMMTAQRGDEAFYQDVIRRTPLGRWAAPHEMGGAAVFLASDAASYVTGHLLFVDGGLTVSI